MAGSASEGRTAGGHCKGSSFFSVQVKPAGVAPYSILGPGEAPACSYPDERAVGRQGHGLYAGQWQLSLEPSRPGQQAGSEAALGGGDTGRK